MDDRSARDLPVIVEATFVVRVRVAAGSRAEADWWLGRREDRFIRSAQARAPLSRNVMTLWSDVSRQES